MTMNKNPSWIIMQFDTLSMSQFGCVHITFPFSYLGSPLFDLVVVWNTSINNTTWQTLVTFHELQLRATMLQPQQHPWQSQIICIPPTKAALIKKTIVSLDLDAADWVKWRKKDRSKSELHDALHRRSFVTKTNSRAQAQVQVQAGREWV